MKTEGESVVHRMLKLKDELGSGCNLHSNLPADVILRSCRLQSQKLRMRPSQVVMHSTAAQECEKSSLQHLPVPPLHDTLDKYIKSVKPLITDSEFAITKRLVTDFGAHGGIGDKLQKLLEERAKCEESWLSEWWLHSAYLDIRWPLVVYSSPGHVFPLQKFNSQDEQLQYAAKLIAGALDYKMLIDQNKIPAEFMGKDPLDMSQYLKVIGTCRIPGLKRDRLTYLDQDDPARHIIVAHNNHLFKVCVLGPQPLNEQQILSQLQQVVLQSQHKGTPVGILTTEHRNTWGQVYKRLSCEVVNRFSLSEIQKSLFLVCLDGPTAGTDGVNDQTAVALKMIHGCGSQSNSGNRWYDKTIQFVVGCEGAVGLSFEHSPADGQPIANLADHVVKYIETAQCNRPPAPEVLSPERLKFVIPDDVQTAIATAERNLDALVEDFQLSCFTFRGYGKDFIKTQRLSPDSFIQMAIQLAFYRLHNEPGAHYEAASVRKFLHGRTEAIRSCSCESVAFARSMLDKQSSVDEKANALTTAINSHKRYTVGALNGLGVDRHLLGLKLVAIEKGLDVPKLFLDSGFIRSTHFRLLTSQVAARCDAFMCYGPEAPDGYACCYNPRDKELIFGMSAFRSSPETDAGRLQDALDKSLREMQDVLLLSNTMSKL